MLIKAVGISDDIEVETYDPLTTSEGDVFLLCSDGLTEYIDEGRFTPFINYTHNI